MNIPNTIRRVESEGFGAIFNVEMTMLRLHIVPLLRHCARLNITLPGFSDHILEEPIPAAVERLQFLFGNCITYSIAPEIQGSFYSYDKFFCAGLDEVFKYIFKDYCLPWYDRSLLNSSNVSIALDGEKIAMYFKALDYIRANNITEIDISSHNSQGFIYPNTIFGCNSYEGFSIYDKTRNEFLYPAFVSRQDFGEHFYYCYVVVHPYHICDVLFLMTVADDNLLTDCLITLWENARNDLDRLVNYYQLRREDINNYIKSASGNKYYFNLQDVFSYSFIESFWSPDYNYNGEDEVIGDTQVLTGDIEDIDETTLNIRLTV